MDIEDYKKMPSDELLDLLHRGLESVNKGKLESLSVKKEIDARPLREALARGDSAGWDSAEAESEAVKKLADVLKHWALDVARWKTFFSGEGEEEEDENGFLLIKVPIEFDDELKGLLDRLYALDDASG